MHQTRFYPRTAGTLAFPVESLSVLATANRVCLGLRSQPLAEIPGRFSSSSLPPSFRSGALRRHFFSRRLNTALNAICLGGACVR